jgi:hypothetical protein
MLRLTFIAIVFTLAVLVVGVADERNPPSPKPSANSKPTATSQPAASQPVTSRPGTPGRSLRPPQQAEVVESLLRDRQQSTAIWPQGPGSLGGPGAPESGPGSERGGPALLAEGTVLVERPGRLVWEENRPMFVFHAVGVEAASRTMELLPNGFLEAMERESQQRGSLDFVVSGEVTRYKDRNFLLLTKLIHRVSHGNLAP